MASRTLTLTTTDGDRHYAVDVVEDGARRMARIAGVEYDVLDDGPGQMRIASTNAAAAWAIVIGDARWVFVNGRVYELTEARQAARGRSGHPGSLTAPMPATVLRVLVKEGDAVKRGDSLIILEAMKMELPVRAAAAGTVTAVRCREGELVQPGVPLIELRDA
jgi:biotin carboxyl carrier protein